MSKVKQWAWDTAEKVSDDIINSYVKGDIDINKAKEKMSNVDNLDLGGFFVALYILVEISCFGFATFLA